MLGDPDFRRITLKLLSFSVLSGLLSIVGALFLASPRNYFNRQRFALFNTVILLNIKFFKRSTLSLPLIELEILYKKGVPRIRSDMICSILKRPQSPQIVPVRLSALKKILGNMSKKILTLCTAFCFMVNYQAVASNFTSNERSTRQLHDNWLYDPYGLSAPYVTPFLQHRGLQEASVSLGYSNSAGSSLLYQNIHPYFAAPLGSSSDVQSRANNFGGAAFNNFLTNRLNNVNRFRPFVNFLPVQLNPNIPNYLASVDSCTSPFGEFGVCAPKAVCSVYGGRPSGSCTGGAVCCINTVTSCGATVTLNNTYWQSPTSAISTPSTCTLTVKLGPRFVEQKRPICQVRLDFVAFITATPSATSGTSRGVCDIDTFQVGGASTTPPLICGDNVGQHMYLNVPNSGAMATDLQMVFNFGSGTTITRSWNIKVAFLPCGADYLAPAGCLQYFTSTTGKIFSFNFKDTTPASRKLVNQDYHMCFRTELVNGQKANQMCLEECSVSSGNNAFRISGGIGLSQTVESTGFCQNDYLVFVGATNNDNLALDRLCGGSLNTASLDGKTTVCSKVTPFKIYFHTDATEIVTDTVTDSVTGDITVFLGDELNVGFCLNFQQKVA